MHGIGMGLTTTGTTTTRLIATEFFLFSPASLGSLGSYLASPILK